MTPYSLKSPNKHTWSSFFTNKYQQLVKNNGGKSCGFVLLIWQSYDQLNIIR